jgi:hypothetical protein
VKRSAIVVTLGSGTREQIDSISVPPTAKPLGSFVSVKGIERLRQ